MRWKRARGFCSSTSPWPSSATRTAQCECALRADAIGHARRLRPQRVQACSPGPSLIFQADVVLVAHGFAPPRLPECDDFAELAVDENGCLMVDAAQMTNLPGVFAAGSIARWPISIIEVMGDARKAASAIDRYLASRRA